MPSGTYPLERFDDLDVRPERPGHATLRALAVARTDFFRQYAHYPSQFAMTTVAYDALQSKLPGTRRGTEKIFYNMRMYADDSLGITDDQMVVST